MLRTAAGRCLPRSQRLGATSLGQGHVLVLDSGRFLHVMRDSDHSKKATAGGEDVWHVPFGGNHLLGRGELIDELWPLVSPGERPPLSV